MTGYIRLTARISNSLLEMAYIKRDGVKLLCFFKTYSDRTLQNQATTWIPEPVLRWNRVTGIATDTEVSQVVDYLTTLHIIIIIYLNCKWVSTRWQWYYNRTTHK
jgi:hypothetical protein